MALFGKDKDGGNPVAEMVRPAGTSSDGIAPREVTMGEREGVKPVGGGGVDAFLGKGSRITGKVVLDGVGRIEGHVEGEISAQDTLTIGESAVVNARIVGTSIVIEGRVTGDVTARQRLELAPTSRVQGNVSTPNLVVREGAYFEGQCTMGGADNAAAKDKAAARPAATPERRPNDASSQAAPPRI
jgi:cytoskeletal protein CcmA (bactofilin family)